MAEKHRSSVTRKPMFCLFTVTSMLFFLSWFFVLRSSGRPRLLPNKQLLLPVVHHGNHESSTESNTRTSSGKQSVGFDKEEEEASTGELASEGKVSEEQKHKNGSKGSSLSSNRYGKVHPLKVYMYDLDPEFHFELLDWKRQGDSVWPDIRTTIPHYPGALNLQHSVEYWLTLDLLASEFHDYPSSLTAKRVRNSSEADVIFVPFFSSLSANRYNRVNPQEKKSRNHILQEKLVKFLTSQKEWKSSRGLDHVIMAHHPNSMLNARMKLWPAMFILSDFGRYPPNIANIDKDVIAPYTHIVKTYINDASDFDTRPTLLYFRGAINRKDGGSVRQELYYLLRDEKDVYFSFGSVQKDGIRQASHGMRSSKFCLNIAGDTPSSNRLFDAIVSHCVPVIISDDIELPYEDVLDYSEFCIFVRTSDALKPKFLINLMRSIKKHEWTRMWKKLKEVEQFYEFQFPSKDGDAVQMIWQAVARKIPTVRMKIHRNSRFSQTAAHPQIG